MALLAFINKKTATNLKMQSRPRADTTRIAHDVLFEALNTCAQDLGLDSTDAVIQCLRQKESAVCTTMLHCLGIQLAQALGKLDGHIRAVYIPYDDAPVDDNQTQIENDHAIGLLIWREQKAATFDSLVADLGRAVTQACQDMIGVQDLLARPKAYVIDDTDLQKHFGSAKFKRPCLRQAAYMLRAHDKLVDIAYARKGLN
ncbi:MAG: hypothetical protein JXA89_09980 [Anaerolineae bacterium]|nr:hypothetical protein [Anaerolineae bacterium]